MGKTTDHDDGPLDGAEFITEIGNGNVEQPPVCKLIHLEYELGWGQRIEGVLYFSSFSGARAYKKAYDARHNTDDHIPDWYMAYSGPDPLTEQDYEK